MIFDENGFICPSDDDAITGPNIKPFRCKPLSKIDPDNYILFAGTSHTEGVGVDIDDSYPFLVAKHFNYDYFNLSIGGTGNDVIEHNLLVWSYLFRDHQPKYVFVEWPPNERYLAKYPGYENFIPTGNWSDDSNAIDLLIKGKDVFANKSKMLYNLTRCLFKCPVFDVRYTSLLTDDSDTIWLEKLDKGTDNSHPGPKSHKDVSEKIIERIMTR